MKKFEAHGSYPKTVYRVFDKLEYANDFINGNIRFSLIQNYKNIEDIIRKDATEGEHYIKYNGMSYRGSFASNSIYILCCHRTLESAQNSKFGKFIVEVNNSKLLAKKLTQWINNQTKKYYGGIEGTCVKYTYAEEIKEKSILDKRDILSYSQKPKNFSNENEFRFIFIKEHSEEPYIFIKLNEILNFCKVIK